MPLVCFASPKGGVGKTMLVANVAHELARLGGRVLVLDADPQSALGGHFGIDIYAAAGFFSQLRPGMDPRLWRHMVQTTANGVGVLTHGRMPAEHSVQISAMLAAAPDLLAGAMRDMLADGSTIVLVDMPPGGSAALSALAPMSHILATVLLVDAMSLAQVPVIEAGQFYGPVTADALADGRLCYILNQFDPRTRLGRAAQETASRHFGNRLLGIVYRDENVPEAAAAQNVVAEHAPNSRGAQDIAALGIAIAERLAPNDAAAERLFARQENVA